MKRFIKFSFILLTLFLFTKVVNANEAICKYTISLFPAQYKITVTYNNGVVSSSMEYADDRYIRNTIIKEADFFRTGVLSCPKKLYYLTFNEAYVAQAPMDISAEFIDGGTDTPLVDETLKPSGNVPDPDGGQPEPDHDAVPEQCTPTGQTFAVCESYETYDAARNACVQKPLFIEYKNTIVTIDGYNDHFLDYKMVEPTFGKCSAAYYYGKTFDGEYKCFLKTCIGKGQRRGDKCILCEELKNNGSEGVPFDDSPIGPAEPPTCADFQEITGPIWFWIKIIGPILAIVFGTMDLLKAVAASDEKGTKKAVSDFGKRLALCALLFLLHIIVNMLVGFTSYGGVGSCL